MKHFKLFLLVILLSALLFTNMTEAEEKESEVYKLDEIVVTATKSEKTIMDAPGSVDVITKDEINKRNIKDIDEAVRMIPGIYDLKRKGFADISPSINIRGVYGTNRNLILIDGQPVSEHVWRRFPLELIEKIEVVKGPFSSLYGSNAMGGVVNIITSEPKEKLEMTINTGFESNNSQLYEMLCSGKADKWIYSASARKRQTDGYASNLTVKKATPQTAEPTSGTKVTGADATTDKYGNERFLIGNTGENYYKDLSYNFKIGREFSPDSNIRIDYTRTDYEYGYKGGESYLRDASGNEVKSGTVYF
ncbi:MAG: TonB-dependent receptor plug domain-containing protein, partial [Deltaproteobacteria bacterium]|nr:TonB-dependent receptor plug domain-containing protein [Deltaproteobacteria bacterium]